MTFKSKGFSGFRRKLAVAHTKLSYQGELSNALFRSSFKLATNKRARMNEKHAGKSNNTHKMK